MLRCLLLSLACVATAASAGGLESFTDTNRLVWDKTFDASARRFFGKLRGSYFWKNGLVAEQVMAGLGGPPDTIRKVDGTAFYLASACRAHSCIEKAAVILSAPDQPAAFAILHYACIVRTANPSCPRNPSLLIFTRRTPAAPEVRAALLDWARGHAGELAGTETRLLH